MNVREEGRRLELERKIEAEKPRWFVEGHWGRMTRLHAELEKVERRLET